VPSGEPLAIGEGPAFSVYPFGRPGGWYEVAQPKANGLETRVETAASDPDPRTPRSPKITARSG